MTQPEEVEMAAVINSFNRIDLLRKGLPSLIKVVSELPTTAIFIFDAGSTDGSLEYIREMQKSNPEAQLRIIAPELDRTSFSAGVNRGCNLACSLFNNLKWLFLFETDNYIESSQPLIQAIELLKLHPELAAVGFTVKLYDGRYTGCARSFPTVLQFVLGQQACHRFKLGEPRFSWQETQNITWSYVDIAFTSPILIRKQAWIESKGMDEANFPFSDCDLDWSWNLNTLGWKISVLRTSSIYHDNQLRKSEWSSTRVIHNHKARILLLQKHSALNITIVSILLLIRHSAEILVLMIIYFRSPHLKPSLHKRQHLVKLALKRYNLC